MTINLWLMDLCGAQRKPRQFEVLTIKIQHKSVVLVPNKSSWTLFQYWSRLSSFSDFHCKDETVVKLSHFIMKILILVTYLFTVFIETPSLHAQCIFSVPVVHLTKMNLVIDKWKPAGVWSSRLYCLRVSNSYYLNLAPALEYVNCMNILK